MSTRADKVDRCVAVNRLLRVIASCGREFFRHGERISHLSVDVRGRVWFHDSYSEKRIYTHYKYEWRGFTGGGTLRSLVCALRDYVCTGKPARLHLGPWPTTFCDGDLWGYGDDMQRVRDAAVKIREGAK